MSMHRLLLAFFAAAVCAEANGYPKDHGPFPLGQSPSKVRLHACRLVKVEHLPDDGPEYPSILYYAEKADAKKLVVRMEALSGTNAYGWVIIVLDGKGVPLSKPATNNMPGFVSSVFCADLNQDGQPDFLVNIWSEGCGLGGSLSETTFLMSSGTRYAATEFTTFDFGPEDLVRFKPGGPCYFIDNGLFDNGQEHTRDGRNHNFWVYQLYRFDKDGMVAANGDDARFPKWVWYTFRENHDETTQLTPAQKKRLLDK